MLLKKIVMKLFFLWITLKCQEYIITNILVIKRTILIIVSVMIVNTTITLIIVSFEFPDNPMAISEVIETHGILCVINYVKL